MLSDVIFTSFIFYLSLLLCELLIELKRMIILFIEYYLKITCYHNIV